MPVYLDVPYEEMLEALEEMGHVPHDTTHADGLSIAGSLGCVPAEIRDYLRERCGYRVVYSGVMRRGYLANTCINCGALQGFFHLFEEVGSPFFIDTVEKLEALEFIKVEVRGIYGTVSDYHSNDDMIYKYAETHHEDFPKRLVEGIYL